MWFAKSKGVNDSIFDEMQESGMLDCLEQIQDKNVAELTDLANSLLKTYFGATEEATDG